MIRASTLRDMVRLEKQAKFPINHINNRTVILKRTCEENGKLIASSFVNTTTETSIIFAEGTNKLERARAVKELYLEIVAELIKRGYTDNHMFVEDEEFAELVQRHLGFEKATGAALVKQLNG